MYKLTISIERNGYDDDFCFIKDGVIIDEGRSFSVSSLTTQGLYEEFARTVQVGHRSGAKPGTNGYGHVTYYHTVFTRDLRELLVHRKCVGGFDSTILTTGDGVMLLHKAEHHHRSQVPFSFAQCFGGNHDFSVELTYHAGLTVAGIATRFAEVIESRNEFVRRFDKNSLRSDVVGLLADLDNLKAEDSDEQSVARVREALNTTLSRIDSGRLDV